jgi:hypothetical protein
LTFEEKQWLSLLTEQKLAGLAILMGVILVYMAMNFYWTFIMWNILYIWSGKGSKSMLKVYGEKSDNENLPTVEQSELKEKAGKPRGQKAGESKTEHDIHSIVRSDSKNTHGSLRLVKIPENGQKANKNSFFTKYEESRDSENEFKLLWFTAGDLSKMQKSGQHKIVI